MNRRDKNTIGLIAAVLISAFILWAAWPDLIAPNLPTVWQMLTGGS